MNGTIVEGHGQSVAGNVKETVPLAEIARELRRTQFAVGARVHKLKLKRKPARAP